MQLTSNFHERSIAVGRTVCGVTDDEIVNRGMQMTDNTETMSEEHQALYDSKMSIDSDAERQKLLS